MTPLSGIHWLSVLVGRGVVASVGWFWAASRTISQGALTMASLFQTPPRDRSYQGRRGARRQEQRSSDAEPPQDSHGLTRAHSGSHSLIRAPWLPARTNGSGRDAVPRMPHEGVPCPVEGHPEMVEEPMLGIYNTHHTLVSGRSGGEESVHGTLCISGNLAHREWRWSSVMPALLPHTPTQTLDFCTYCYHGSGHRCRRLI